MTNTQETATNNEATANSNSIELFARVANEIVVERTATGKQVTNFSICQSVKDDETEKYSPMFIRAKGWNKMAELLENHLRIGDLVKFRVRPTINKYTNSTGAPVEEVVLIVEKFFFLKASKRQQRLAEKNNETTALAVVA